MLTNNEIISVEENISGEENISVTVARNSFRAAINQLRKIPKLNATLEALNSFQVTANGNLQISAANPSTIARIGISGNTKIEGTVYLPSNLVKAINAMTGKIFSIDMTIHSDGQVVISDDRVSLSIYPVTGNDFPVIPSNNKDKHVFSVEGKELCRALSICGQTTAKDNSIKPLVGIHFRKNSDTSIVVESSNTISIVQCQVPIMETDLSNKVLDFVINPNTAKCFGMFSKELIHVSIAKDHITFRQGDKVLSGITIESSYPGIYKTISKDKKPLVITGIDKKSVADTLKVVKFVSDKVELIYDKENDTFFANAVAEESSVNSIIDGDAIQKKTGKKDSEDKNDSEKENQIIVTLDVDQLITVINLFDTKNIVFSIGELFHVSSIDGNVNACIIPLING